MGMQVSCGVHSEVSAQGDVRVDTQRAWVDDEGVGPTQGERGGGGASDGRPRAHDVVDPAEVFGIRGGGVYQREERDSDRSKIYGSEEELCWVELLGEGDITCRRWGGTRCECASTSESRRKKIVGSIN